MLCWVPSKQQRGEGRVLFPADDVERVKQSGEPRKKGKKIKRKLVLQKVQSDMNSNRLRTLWGQSVLTSGFYLTFRAWNRHLEIKVPQEGVKEDNEIYHITACQDSRLTKCTTA